LIIVPLFPIVQGQWLNISLLIDNHISIYNIIYYFSGYLFPIILIFYSLNNFSDYQFITNNGKEIKNCFRYISFLVFPILLLFSALITKYFIYLFLKINNDSFNFLAFNNFQFIFILIFSFLLLIKKTKKVKSLYLIYYLINFSIYWTINTYPFNISNIFLNENYINNFIANNLDFNYINTIFLFLLETLYFIWSYISYKNNLSDWRIPKPIKSNFYPLVHIFLFYFGLFVYFYIFRNISL